MYLWTTQNLTRLDKVSLDYLISLWIIQNTSRLFNVFSDHVIFLSGLSNVSLDAQVINLLLFLLISTLPCESNNGLVVTMYSGSGDRFQERLVLNIKK